MEKTKNICRKGREYWSIDGSQKTGMRERMKGAWGERRERYRWGGGGGGGIRNHIGGCGGGHRPGVKRG